MTKNDQKFRNYTPEFKMEAVRLNLEEGLSYQASEKMGVPSNSQINHWVKNIGSKRQSGL
jgi:transposase-like protein